ncbi:MAG: tetratricopeptide repeat protein, partial [Sphingomonadales bacterium]
YKIACTYYNEQSWEAAYKQVDTAIRMHRSQFDYQVLAGECCVQLGRTKEAVQHFMQAVRAKPRNKAGWESLVRCLYQAEWWSEALLQTSLALQATKNKPLFLYYKAAVLFGSGQSKEGLLQLEEALHQDARLLKRFVSLRPSILQNPQVVDLLARYKRKA